MLRLAVLVEGCPPHRHLGRMLDALQRAQDIELTSLVMTGGERRQTSGETIWAALARRVSRVILTLETWALLTAASFSRRLRKRTAILSDTGRQVEDRFAELATLGPDGQLRLKELPDVLLVLGHWFPDVAAQWSSKVRIIQVLWGHSPLPDLSLAGFDECEAGLDQTAVRLYRIEPAARSLQLVIDGRNRTKLLFSLNQAACWDRATSMLQSELACGSMLSAKLSDGAAVPRQPEWSRLLRLLTYPLRILLRGVYMATRHVGGKHRWNVAIHRSGELWTSLVEPMQVEAPPAGTYHADPMLYWHGPTATMYCYVEEFDRETDRAHIAVLQESSGTWKRLGVALREPFHLSFPFLFEYEDQLYMCPESGASGCITAYRCIGFPLRWERSAVLMRDVSATDTMIFQHDGRWWMLTNIDRAVYPDHQSELHLFYADSPLTGEWHSVPGNPVKVDCHGARNGGMKMLNDRIYRFGQVQSFHSYGHRLNVYEVSRLDVGGYCETLVDELAMPPQSSSVGMHTFSSVAGRIAVDLLGKP